MSDNTTSGLKFKYLKYRTYLGAQLVAAVNYSRFFYISFNCYFESGVF